MMKTLMTAVKTSISEVMETMFYLPVEFGEDFPLRRIRQDKTQPDQACRLSFSGDFSGCFILLAPKDLLFEMTENFMGESREDFGDEHLQGTLTETLNMICGNSLSRIDSKSPFSLGIPEMMDASEIPESEVFTIVETTQSKMAIHVTVTP